MSSGFSSFLISASTYVISLALEFIGVLILARGRFTLGVFVVFLGLAYFGIVNSYTKSKRRKREMLEAQIKAKEMFRPKE